MYFSFWGTLYCKENTKGGQKSELGCSQCGIGGEDACDKRNATFMWKDEGIDACMISHFVKDKDLLAMACTFAGVSPTNVSPTSASKVKFACTPTFTCDSSEE